MSEENNKAEKEKYPTLGGYVAYLANQARVGEMEIELSDKDNRKKKKKYNVIDEREEDLLREICETIEKKECSVELVEIPSIFVEDANIRNLFLQYLQKGGDSNVFFEELKKEVKEVRQRDEEKKIKTVAQERLADYRGLVSEEYHRQDPQTASRLVSSAGIGFPKTPGHRQKTVLGIRIGMGGYL